MSGRQQTGKIIIINGVFFKARTVSLGWCGTWQSPCQSAMLGDGEKRVGGALRMGPYMGRLVYLKRGRKTPADRLSEAER